MNFKGIAIAIACAASVAVSDGSMAQSTRSKTTEHSTASQQSQKQSFTESSRTESKTVVSVNQMLLDYWVRHFETRPGGKGEPWESLAKIKILSSPRDYFPSLCPITSERARVCRFVDMLDYYQSGDGRNKIFYAMGVPNRHEIRAGITQDYIAAALLTHFMLDEAAYYLTSPAFGPITKNNLDSKIALAVETASYMGIGRALDQMREVIRSISSCSSQAIYASNHQQQEGNFRLVCGPIVIDANKPEYRINGVQTLSAESIAGNRIEVTLVDDSQATATAEKSKSKSVKGAESSSKSYQSR
ncbi:MAG: hypothetical protein AB1697_04895 [Pseudomonadota bacterium]